MRNDTFRIPLLSSVTVHVLVILLGSILFHNSNLRRQDFLSISLVDVPRADPPPRKFQEPAEKIKPPPPMAKVKKPKAPPSLSKAPIGKSEAPAQSLAPVKEEAPKAIETKPDAPAKLESPQSFASGARGEGGGSEAGAGNLSGKGDVAVVPGAGTAGGGGGTADSGLGRGAGAPGLAAQPVLKTNREARPMQTVRAAYPPMALRAGLESDVTLKIEIDPDGKVTKAEIIKSGGAGFDEEALKAVKQSRFEPAQRNGQNIAAEFTYIYRFRLHR